MRLAPILSISRARSRCENSEAIETPYGENSCQNCAPEQGVRGGRQIFVRKRQDPPERVLGQVLGNHPRTIEIQSDSTTCTIDLANLYQILLGASRVTRRLPIRRPHENVTLCFATQLVLMAEGGGFEPLPNGKSDLTDFNRSL